LRLLKGERGERIRRRIKTLLSFSRKREKRKEKRKKGREKREKGREFIKVFEGGLIR